MARTVVITARNGSRRRDPRASGALRCCQRLLTCNASKPPGRQGARAPRAPNLVNAPTTRSFWTAAGHAASEIPPVALHALTFARLPTTQTLADAFESQRQVPEHQPSLEPKHSVAES